MVVEVAHLMEEVVLASEWTKVSFQDKGILLRLPLQILEAVWAFLKLAFWAAFS